MTASVLVSLKHVHILTVALSFAGFLLRAFWAWRRPARLRARLVRTLPHVNDTVLLSTGLAMLYLYGGSPYGSAWLGTKIGALTLYIVLGAIALRYGRTGGQRAMALVAALGAFAYIVAVALSKQAVPFT